MQFLIFAFILLSLLSSLRKKARRSRRKEHFFDPWSFEEESPEDKTESIIKKIEEEPIDKEIFKLTVEPKIEEAEEQGDQVENISQPEEEKEFEPLLELEMAEPFIPSLLLEEGGKKAKTAARGSIDSQQELKGLLLGQQLPLAIVASEILGPPRAFRPIRNRLLQRPAR